MNTKPIKYITSYLINNLKGIKEIFTHPKNLLPLFIMTIIWTTLSLIVASGNDNIIVYILSMLTFSQGGMYGGIFGIIGGIIGKSLLAYFITSLFLPKNKIKKENIKISNKFDIIIGFGFSLILYNFLTGNASLENMIIGIFIVIELIKNINNSNYFWYGFFETFSSKKLAKSIFIGMILGNIISIILSVVYVKASYYLYIIGLVLLIAITIYKIINNKKVKVSLFALIIFTSFLPNVRANIFPTDGDFNGMGIEYTIGGCSENEINDVDDFTNYREIEGTCSSSTITLTGTIKARSGADTIASASITINGREDTFEKDFKVAGGSTSFSLKLNLKDTDEKIYISIHEQGEYANGEGRGLDVSGVFINTNYNSSKQNTSTNKVDNDSTSYIEKMTQREEHLNMKDTAIVAILTTILSILSIVTGIPFASLSKILNHSKEKSVVITDPASNAETLYIYNETTDEWISSDGSSILDPAKLPDWYKQRNNDKLWNKEQIEKIKNDTSKSDAAKKIKEKLNKDLDDLKNDAQKRDADYKKLKKQMAETDIKYGTKEFERYDQLAKLNEFGTEVATLVSATADSIIDGYGIKNKWFTAGYKLIKATTVGGFTGGKAGFISGAIDGTTDDAIVLLGSSIGTSLKVTLRGGSRVVSSIAKKVISDDEAYNALINGDFNNSKLKEAFIDGGINGGVHAMTGFLLDKTKAKTMGAFNTKKIFEQEAMNQIAYQRTIIRTLRDGLKPYANKLKGDNK